MANHKSAIKAHRIHEARRLRNRELRTRLRRALKSARAAADGGGDDTADTADKKDALRTTVSLIDSMVHKGIIHRNAAARYKSRLVSRTRRAASAVA